MIAGMYVVREDGTTAQVARILDSAIGGPGGVPDPCSLYELSPDDGGAPSYVRQPTDTQLARHGLVRERLHLLPGCGSCGAAAGWACYEGCSAPRTRLRATRRTL